MVDRYDLNLQFSTRRTLGTSEDVMQILALVEQYAPELMPQRYDFGEPIRRPYDQERVRREVGQSRGSLLWKRDHPRVLGQLMPEKFGDPEFAQVKIGTQANSIDARQIVDLVRNASGPLNADIAFVEVLRGRGERRANRMGSCFSVPTHVLLRGLPLLTWATVLGPSYIKHFGRERVLTSPAAVVDEVAPNTVYLQLTTDIFDVERHFRDFEATRERVKAHLGLDSFFRPGIPEEQQHCRVPHFDWEEFRPKTFGRLRMRDDGTVERMQ